MFLVHPILQSRDREGEFHLLAETELPPVQDDAYSLICIVCQTTLAVLRDTENVPLSLVLLREMHMTSVPSDWMKRSFTVRMF